MAQGGLGSRPHGTAALQRRSRGSPRDGAGQGAAAAADSSSRSCAGQGTTPPASGSRSVEKAAPAVAGQGKQSFQINIRQPLPELTPRQATHYLGRISTALPVLAERAVEEIEAADARELAETLEAAARRLRERV